MNLIRFLVNLILRFCEVDSTEFAKVQEEAYQKWAAIRIDEDAPKKDFMFHLKKYSEHFMVKLLLCVVYIIAVRQIQDYMNPQKTSDDE